MKKKCDISHLGTICTSTKSVHNGLGLLERFFVKKKKVKMKKPFISYTSYAIDIKRYETYHIIENFNSRKKLAIYKSEGSRVTGTALLPMTHRRHIIFTTRRKCKP